MEAQDNAFHSTTKPNWGPNGAFVYTTKPVTPRHADGLVVNFGSTVVGERADVRFAKLNTPDVSHAPNCIVSFITNKSKLLSGTIPEQQTFTGLTIQDGVPRATTSDDFFFAQFAEEVPVDTLAGRQEKHAWELATILFDRIDIPSGVATDKVGEFELRDRKEQLSSFWKKLVHADATAAASNATTLEEKALHYLSGGMTEEACFALLEGQNFRLATLVPQIGGDNTFREFIATQLADWQKLNVLSEFSDEIRAIYELLAGNTSLCSGSNGPGMENKFSEFNISSRFNFDWRRSFGLRLWYGIKSTDDLKEAVQQLVEDLSTGAELINPAPWFVEKKLDMGWTDPSPDSREDILWALLKLHSDQLSEDLETALAPENISGNPMNTRLSFQFVNLFRALELGGVDESSATADALAFTYASGLATSVSNKPHVIHTTIWVLMHISDPQVREQTIRALLDQHAPLLEPPTGQLYKDLIELRVPPRWVHLSKALYAHAVTRDTVAEAQSLIEAGEWKQAHELVCKVIGPAAVIEQDSDQLRELLGALVEQKEGNRLEWNRGAGMFYDYIEMKDLERQRGQRWKELVMRLSKALEGVMGAGLRGRDLTERAALQMMGADVAKLAASGDVLDHGMALRLPLTEDAYLKHSRILAVDYFKAVLGGR
jgi:nuclear pore complex protein Nup98-Nup96